MDLVAEFKRQRVQKFLDFRHELHTGERGPKGEKGDTGPAGPQGPIGERGPVGPPGSKGDLGPTGLRGERGLQGKDGKDGAKGPQGDLGPMPKHQKRGDAIRFEIEPGIWGSWIALSGMQSTAIAGSVLTADNVVTLIEEYALVPQYNTLIDTVGDLKYIGYSDPGTAESAALWRIKRLDTSDAGGDIPVLYANGSSDFTFVWDDRLTYTYTPTGS